MDSSTSDLASHTFSPTGELNLTILPVCPGDDVLTSGKHFKVARTRIQKIFPGKPILGIFVARCIHANPFGQFAHCR